jgi:hypothetical protein
MSVIGLVNSDVCGGKEAQPNLGDAAKGGTGGIKPSVLLAR